MRKGAPLSRLLLLPLAWLWAGVTAWKIGHGKPGDPGVPVICVGNLTLGGAGKTPSLSGTYSDSLTVTITPQDISASSLNDCNAQGAL